MNNIKKFRLEKNITLKQLALITNISMGYLSHLENGTRKNPSYAIMKKIAIAFDKDISLIFP
ncbi:MAG: helix-turn-helix transcriptional regulator [Clostridiales bacterium]|nr:helix-turn-helix transcriptional regulator [Clostridiales bacterium]